jgi:hypothetical protein
MIAIIERSLFNYACKYDFIDLSPDRIFDDELELILIEVGNSLGFSNWVAKFDECLPIHEEPHELILLSINREGVRYGAKARITYSSINSVIPLSERAAQLLIGRLPEDIFVEQSSLESVYKEVLLRRRIRSREYAFLELSKLFGNEQAPEEDFVLHIKDLVESVSKLNAGEGGSFIQNILLYDKTPGFLPEGNAEYLAKIGIIAANTNGKGDETFKKGTFFKWCTNERFKLAELSVSDALEYYFDCVKDNRLSTADLSKSHQTILDIINEPDSVGYFRMAYYFIAFKDLLQKVDFDLYRVDFAFYRQLKLSGLDGKVLCMIAYTYGFEGLYEGIHKMRKTNFAFQLQHVKSEICESDSNSRDNVGRKSPEINASESSEYLALTKFKSSADDSDSSNTLHVNDAGKKEEQPLVEGEEQSELTTRVQEEGFAKNILDATMDLTLESSSGLPREERFQSFIRDILKPMEDEDSQWAQIIQYLEDNRAEGINNRVDYILQSIDQLSLNLEQSAIELLHSIR